MTEEGTLQSPGSLDVTEAVRAVEDERNHPCDDRYDAFQWDSREDCEVRQILDRIADKWSLLVVSLLERRTMRFNELRREIDGISQRMLTVTLRHLERDGLVERTIYPEVPPRVEYHMTPLGCTLLDTIQSLVSWTEKHQREILRARARFDLAQHTSDG